ncbi:MAG: endolytic transglycosylase MltG [Rhizobiales bacterium]|nr:endolytic transglycosylase MltG [Hyphomicrobiales bacterium]
MRSPNEALQPDAAPPPPEQKQKRKRKSSTLGSLSGLLTFLLIVAIGVLAAVTVGKKRFEAAGPLEADKVVVVARGAETSDILEQLQRDGVISSASLFNAGLTAYGKRGDIKAGEYNFKAHASMRDVMTTLVEGKSILHAITIPEGLTSEQIVARLKENDVLIGDVREAPKEGALYPDTYKFARGMTREQLLTAMRRKQDEVLKEVWARRAQDIPVRSPFEMLTLASIVEKETGRADERPRVAGVFVNRLQKRMRLQSDPTIVYGLVGGKGTLGRGIMRSEVTQATPYNTYVIDGLPPGPIANPGRAALEAVANPSRTGDLYFVADGTGGHAFAETLDQHARNVARWRQIEKSASDKVDPEAATPAPGAAPTPGAPAAPAQRPGRRGDLGPANVFGALPGAVVAPQAVAAVTEQLAPRKGWAGRFDAAALAPSPELAAAPEPATRGAQQPKPTADKAAPAAREQGGPDKPSPFAAFALSPGAESVPIAGVTASDGLIEPELDPDMATPGSMATYPLSPARRAEMKAKAAHYGFASGSDAPPPPAPAQMASAPAAAAPGARPRVVDASEGTPLDPLLNRSYDLNSAKTIPAFRATP